VSSTINYSGSYQWDQAPPAFPELGSQIQNSRTISLQGTLNFRQLYQKSAWLRNLENPKPKKPATSKDPKDPSYESAIDKSKDSKEKVNPIKLALGNFIMMFKNAGFNYTNTQGTLLPGFSYRPDYFGHNFKHMQPGLDFVFGAQRENIRQQLASEGALNKDPRQSNFYVKGLTESISANVTVEPIKDFRIQLDLSRSEMKNTQSQFRWNGTAWVDDGLMENGQYNISGIFLKTHFIKDRDEGKEHPNAVFEQFLGNRFTVAQRLMFQDPRVQGLDPVTGFPEGYSANSQNVLVGAFLSAYAGKDAGRSDVSGFPKIPLPGWTVNYNGLGKIKALKRIFSNINIKHSYNGKYSISGFSRNLHYNDQEIPAPGKDFTPLYHMADVTISEGFYPLIGVNIATKNNWTMGFDYKRSRTVKLFAAYFNLTEQRMNELQLNAGYRVTGLTLPFKRNGRRVYLPNDFRFDLAVAVQDNVTAVRKIDITFNQYTAGMRTVRISPTASYQINQKLNLSFKYNRMVLNPKVSTQYYTALTDFGLELRYTLN
jgi:cell surface protein SprA